MLFDVSAGGTAVIRKLKDWELSVGKATYNIVTLMTSVYGNIPYPTLPTIPYYHTFLPVCLIDLVREG